MINKKIKMLQVYIMLLNAIEDLQDISYMLTGKRMAFDGGEGSGHFGHAGRYGEVGGSLPEKSGSRATSAIRRSLFGERKKDLSASKADKLKKLRTDGFITQKRYDELSADSVSNSDINREIYDYYNFLADNGDMTVNRDTVNENPPSKSLEAYSIDDPKEREDFLKKCQAETEQNLMKDANISSAKELETLEMAFWNYTVNNDNAEDERKALEKFISNAPVYDGIMYRGASRYKRDYDKLMEQYKKGVEIAMHETPKISSWSDNLETAKNFSRAVGGAVPILYVLHKNRTGVPIDRYSSFGGEHELLHSSKSRFKIMSVEKQTMQDTDFRGNKFDVERTLVHLIETGL